MKTLLKIVCPECGKEFVPHSNQKYCTRKCQIKHNSKVIKQSYVKQDRYCELCGKPIEPGRHKAKYCIACGYEIDKQRSRERSRLREYSNHSIAKKITDTKPNVSLIEAARKAKALGLTYGQYQQKLYREGSGYGA